MSDAILLAPAALAAVGTDAVCLAPLAIEPEAGSICSGRLRNGWTFEIFDQIDAIDPELWREMFPPHWKGHGYYGTLEETFPGEFSQRYLLHYGILDRKIP